MSTVRGLRIWRHAPLAVLAACIGSPPTPRTAEPVISRVEMIALAEFPFEAPWNHELSGLTWDRRTGTFFAVSDEAPVVVALEPEPGFRAWRFTASAPVHAPGLPRWDGEGISRYSDGFVIANERPPGLLVVDPHGTTRRLIPIPAHFARCRDNRCLESAALTPDERFLFTANEAPLLGDLTPESAENGGLVRILRTELGALHQTEFVYRTDPLAASVKAGEVGVADLVALSAEQLLVLERTFIPPETLDVRVYLARLSGAPDVVNRETLDGIPPIDKELVVDLARYELEDRGGAPPPEGYRVLSNYEGMTLGPKLADGRSTLVLVSDDNHRPSQTRRVLTLGVTFGP